MEEEKKEKAPGKKRAIVAPVILRLAEVKGKRTAHWRRRRLIELAA